MKKTLNVAVIGSKFMGKAHSAAWRNAPKFYDLPYEPALKVVCARDPEATAAFAENWGYPETETDWRKVVSRDDIDIVDVCTPTDSHRDIATAAAEAGKHIFCEKPCALNYAQAKSMAEAADKAGVTHYLNHNYRRVPAVAFAKRLIDSGRLGEIYHWRGAYLQDWIMDPSFPATWHLQKKHAGAGPHYDLNSHAVDLSRFLVGEIKSVSAMMKTFISRRPLPGKGAGTFGAGETAASGMGDVDVDDASFMVMEFENGALGAIDASRFAGGRKNYNYFEVYGSKGSIVFNLERMNELEFIGLEDPADEQGFRTIQVTGGSHPYMSAWWAPGHIIGYEHTFAHAVKDFLEALKNASPVYPNLWDGARIMQVLDAGLLSNKEGRKALVSEIK
jgi:predicted dehydrogenase